MVQSSFNSRFHWVCPLGCQENHCKKLNKFKHKEKSHPALSSLCYFILLWLNKCLLHAVSLDIAQKRWTYYHQCPKILSSLNVYSPILREFLLILSFQEPLFLSETPEKITFNPGLWGKLLLILENELETSPSSSPTFSELQQQQPGTLCWLGVGGPDFERVDQD